MTVAKVADGTVEIDFRTSGGIDVALLWHRHTNSVSVSVSDTRTGDRFAVPVSPETALDAFHHPYAYHARRRRRGSRAAARGA